MNKTVYFVGGMTCHNCEKTITEGILKIKGVKEVNASFKTGEIIVIYDNLPNPIKIKKVIEELGYEYRGINSNNRTSFRDILSIILSFLSLYMVIGLIFGYDFLSRIPTISTTTPLIMLFIIGLLTSIHCIGMCGAINLLASVDNDGNKSFKRPLMYNLDRITSYTLIGALIGLIGSFLSINDFTQGLIIFITSIVMFLMGLSMLGWLPEKLFILIPSFKNKIKIKNDSTPFIIGFLNGFMPCGPLQAMQLYALSTGSFFLGGLSLFLFALGTVPLVFSFGFLFSKLKTKYNVMIKKVSSVLIILLSIVMLNRGLNYFGFNISNIINNTFFKVNYSIYQVAEIKDGYQYVEISLGFTAYKPIIVEKGIPVKFNIKAKDVYKYGCTSSIIIPDLNIELTLEEGDNIIEFTPDKVGIINYSCWMRMVTSHIRVVDSLESIGGNYE